MRELSREAFEHDDPSSRRHAKDKREKAERDAVDFIAVPSPLRSGKELTGIDFDADSAGFMFSFGDRCENMAAALGVSPLPIAKRADAKTYQQRIREEEKERRKFRRVVKKNGKTIETWGSHKCGGVSMVVTAPPWAMPVLNSLEDDMRDHLMLGAADRVAARMQQVSDRVPWGGAVHYDTDVAHFHFQIPKTSPIGENWPKSAFKTGGPWLVGAERVDSEFPGLLPKKQKELLESHKARKGQLVDLEIARAVDDYFESQFREMGLGQRYKQAKKEYAMRKKRSRTTERERGLLRESLRFLVLKGIWPLASSAMSFTMWRMIPKEYRPLIYHSIRATQMVASPAKAVMSMSTRYVCEKLREEIYPEPEPTPPIR